MVELEIDQQVFPFILINLNAQWVLWSFFLIERVVETYPPHLTPSSRTASPLPFFLLSSSSTYCASSKKNTTWVSVQLICWRDKIRLHDLSPTHSTVPTLQTSMCVYTWRHELKWASVSVVKCSALYWNTREMSIFWVVRWVDIFCQRSLCSLLVHFEEFGSLSLSLILKVSNIEWNDASLMEKSRSLQSCIMIIFTEKYNLIPYCSLWLPIQYKYLVSSWSTPALYQNWRMQVK